MTTIEPTVGDTKPGRLPARPLARTPLSIVAWADPRTEQIGWPMHSKAVERFWLPTIGPTSYLLARHLVETIGTSIDPEELAGRMGVGWSTSQYCPLTRTITRLQQFSVAQRTGDTIAVRTHLAPLAGWQRAKLPPGLAAAYRRFLEHPELLGRSEPVAPRGTVRRKLD
jgi:hypothetical protein